MATCPNCSVSSRTDGEAIWIEPCFEAIPMGGWSVSGMQLKTVAVMRLRLCCECGWSIVGRIEGEEFLGDPDTQTFPEVQK
jgi:hypothetical protein